MQNFSDDDRCELDPKKICDNCFRCLEPAPGQDYAKIEIAAVYTGEDYLIEYEAEEHVVAVSPASADLKVRTRTLSGSKSEKRPV